MGTNLLYASATKAVGTAVHGAGGSVDWRVVRRLATGSVPATVVTLVALAWSGRGFDGTGHIITTMLGLALIATALAMFFRRSIVARVAGSGAGEGDGRRTARLTVVPGAALGVLVSLSSVGAGALRMTALLILYPHAPTSRLVGSDIAHAVPLTLIAGSGHWATGSVDVALLLSLLAGSVPGIVLGSLVSTRAPDRLLQPLLAMPLALIGGDTL